MMVLCFGIPHMVRGSSGRWWCICTLECIYSLFCDLRWWTKLRQIVYRNLGNTSKIKSIWWIYRWISRSTFFYYFVLYPDTLTQTAVQLFLQHNGMKNISWKIWEEKKKTRRQKAVTEWERVRAAKRAASRDPGGGSQPTRSAFHMCHFLLASVGGGWHDVVASGAPQPVTLTREVTHCTKQTHKPTSFCSYWGVF